MMLRRRHLTANLLCLLLAQLALIVVACAEVQSVEPRATEMPATAAPVENRASPLGATTARPLPATVPRLTALPPPTSAAAVATVAAAPTPTLQPTETRAPWYEQSVLGASVDGRAIELHRLGTGPVNLVLVGGHHGGYEWNTTLLAYEVIDQLRAAPDTIPARLTVYVIPNANPDGTFVVTGREGRFSRADVDESQAVGRLNARDVDLNRNWDCLWEPFGVWRNQQVSGGAYPFSEPENVLLRDFFLRTAPALVVFWHSAAGGVYASGCPELYRPAYDLAAVYALAAGYPLYERFDHYAITGDASDWLALQSIPSFTVELYTHEQLDWSANHAGLIAILELLSTIE